MRQLAVGPAQSPVVSEQQVNFQGSVTGRGTDLKSLDSADVTLTVDADRLQVELKEAPGESNPFRFELSGDLASWVQRLKVASPSSFYLDGIAIAGQIQSTGEGALDNEVVQVSKIQATATNLAIDSADGLRLREPQVNFAADFAWNANTGVLASGESQFVGSALTFSTREVTLSPNGPPHNSRGEAVFRGDLGRLVAWFPAAAPGPRWSAEGAFTGRVSLRGEAGGARATASLKGQRFALYQIDSNGQRLVWDEPSLEGALLARLINSTPSAEGQQTEIELEQLTLSSNTLTASATGRIGDVAQMRAVDLAGDIEYDLQQLSPLLWPRLSDSVKLLGKDRATFQVRSDDLTGAGYEGLAARIEAPWQGADLFGLPVGPGRLVGVLDRGVVRFDPLAVSVGEGSLNAVLSSKLYPSPTTVSLAPGPFISGVAISPEVAERFLKYIAPVLADATRIRGNFSLGFSEFNVMTRDVQNSKMSGNLDIHSAEVAPGPAVAEWVALARQVRGVVRDGVESVAQESTTPVLTVRQQTIPFQMANGRVYHRDLIFDVGDVVMTSEGSVGIDETLDLLLTIPIQEEWVQRRPVLLAGLRGQAIRIPVRGTFSRPELDREAFRQISRQLLQSAAEGAINQGLDLLLERLRSR